MKRRLDALGLGLAFVILLSGVGLPQETGCADRVYQFDIVDVEETDYGYGLTANLLTCQEDGSWLQTDSVGQIINLVSVDDIASGEFELLGEEWLLTATFESDILTVILFYLVDEEYLVYQEVQRVNIETQTSYVLPTLDTPGYRIIAIESGDETLKQLYSFDGVTWGPIGDPWTL